MLFFIPEMGIEIFPNPTQFVSVSKKRLTSAVTREIIITDLKLFIYFIIGTQENIAMIITKAAIKIKENMLFDENASAKNSADDIIFNRESNLCTTEFPGKYLQNAKVFIKFKHLCCLEF